MLHYTYSATELIYWFPIRISYIQCFSVFILYKPLQHGLPSNGKTVGNLSKTKFKNLCITFSSWTLLLRSFQMMILRGPASAPVSPSDWSASCNMPISRTLNWPSPNSPAANYNSLCSWKALAVTVRQHTRTKSTLNTVTVSFVMSVSVSPLAVAVVTDKHFHHKSLLDTQEAQLSQRDRAAGYISFGKTWKTGTGGPIQ